MANRKQICVNAIHHGAFLTLESIFSSPEKDDIDVVVIIPQHQIDKYAAFDADAFRDYEKNIREYVGGRAEIYAVANLHGRLAPISRTLLELGKADVWLFLSAGTVFNSFPPWVFAESKKVFGLVDHYFYRKHPNQDMYKMAGCDDNDPPNIDAVIVNLSLVQRQHLHSDSQFLASASRKSVSKMAFMRGDPMVNLALSTISCLRFGGHSLSAFAYNYWPALIAKKVSEEELLAYPFDKYLDLSERLPEGIMPADTSEIIRTRGTEIREMYIELRDLFAT